MKTEKVYFENLDALRVLLAIMVLCSHAMLPETLNSIIDTQITKNLFNALFNGARAVSFFFVLSGFLITYLLLNEKSKKQTINLRKFYIRRILRIWPLYYFVLVFGFFIYPNIKTLIGWESNIANDLYLNLFFLGNFDSLILHENNLVGYAPMMIVILWSVSIEEQFYIIWPLIFLIKESFLEIAITIVLTLSVSFMILNEEHEHIVYYHTISRSMDLSLGGLAALMIYRHNSLKNTLINLPKWLIVVFYLCGFLYYLYPVNLGLPKFFYFCLFYVFIISEQAFCSNSFYNFKNWKWGSKAGKYTYSMYMLHPLGIQAAIILFKLFSINLSSNHYWGILYLIIASVITYFLSIASYRYLESPFLRLKERFK